MRVLTTACLFLGIKCDDLWKHLINAKDLCKQMCAPLYQIKLTWILEDCVCVRARACSHVLMSSRSRTGPHMTNFALLNWQCNLILRQVAKKRILSPLNLKRALKMDGPSGPHQCVSTAPESKQPESTGLYISGIRSQGVSSGGQTTGERWAAFLFFWFPRATKIKCGLEGKEKETGK